MTERAEVPHDLVNIRSSWFPALCVGGEGESVKSKVVKKFVSSGECNFSGRRLKSPIIIIIIIIYERGAIFWREGHPSRHRSHKGDPGDGYVATAT